jgi:hypothetical protein
MRRLWTLAEVLAEQIRRQAALAVRSKPGTGAGHAAHYVDVQSMAEALGASVYAAFIRLHGLRGWTSVLLQWRRGRHGWIVQTEMGLRTGLPDVYAMSNALEFSLAQLATQASGTLLTTQLPLGCDEWTDADVLVGHQSVTAVIEAGRSVGTGSSPTREVGPSTGSASFGSPHALCAY